LIDWSSEDPGDPTEVVDSFDLSDGPVIVLACVECDGVIRPELEMVEEIVAELLVPFERLE